MKKRDDATSFGASDVPTQYFLPKQIFALRVTKFLLQKAT